jgi:hypothetical protein
VTRDSLTDMIEEEKEQMRYRRRVSNMRSMQVPQPGLYISAEPSVPQEEGHYYRFNT